MGWAGPSSKVRKLGRNIRAGVTRLGSLIEHDFIERRRAGRIKPAPLSCNLGAVTDLSGGGMRIISRRPLTGEVTVELWDTDRRVEVQGQVIWTKHLDADEYEIGVEFSSVAPEVVRALTALALSHR